MAILKKRMHISVVVIVAGDNKNKKFKAYINIGKMSHFSLFNFTNTHTHVQHTIIIA